MKLLWSTKQDADYDKGGDVPTLESAEVVLVNCSLVVNNYHQTCKALFTFVPNKQFEQLTTIGPDQNRKQLEIEDNVNMKLIIGEI